jgi:biotin carboxyl carrier protein
VPDSEATASVPAVSAPAPGIETRVTTGSELVVPRTARERAADHRAVERLAGDLLPALIGRLASSGLAEIEVREGAWKVRLRRPLEVVGTGRRATDRQLRLPGSNPAAGALPAGGGAHPGSARPAGGAHPGGGGHAPGDARGSRADARGEGRGDTFAERRGLPTATAPAVGIFRPRNGIRGTAVRSGDRLGVVDMLGIAQDVLAPVDGVVGEILAEPGDGVEYGQDLFAMTAPRGHAADAIPVVAEDQVAAPAGERG